MLHPQAAPGGYAGSTLAGILKVTGQCPEQPGMILELTLLCGGGWTRNLLRCLPVQSMVLCSDQQLIAVQLSSVAQSPACGSTRCWRTLCSHSQRGSPVVPWHTTLAMGPLGVWSTSAVQCKFQLKYSLFLTVNGWCWHSAERGELDLSMTWKNL